jgi:hypothetical protein
VLGWNSSVTHMMGDFCRFAKVVISHENATAEWRVAVGGMHGQLHPSKLSLKVNVRTADGAGAGAGELGSTPGCSLDLTH